LPKKQWVSEEKEGEQKKRAGWEWKKKKSSPGVGMSAEIVKSE